MRSYQLLLHNVRHFGEAHQDRTGVGTRSTFGHQWLHNMANGFPLLTTKRVPLRWVFEELKWFLSGSTNNNDLLDSGVDIWNEWAKEDGDLGPVYGKQWRRWECADGSTIDQIARVLDRIEHSPESRRIILTAYNVGEVEAMALEPCHTLTQFKVHQGKDLSLHLYARSIDSFLGLPFNIASYALLLKMIAHVSGLTPRSLIISFGDLHLYNNHVKQADIQLARIPRKLPQVEITSPVTDNRLESLLAIKWSDVVLTDYNSYPKIKAPVAI